MDKEEPYEPQQEQSPTLKKDKSLAMIQARGLQAGKSSVQKDLKVLAVRKLNMSQWCALAAEKASGTALTGAQLAD